MEIQQWLSTYHLALVVISILSITNVQNFSFLAILNTALMWLLIAAIVTVVGEFPFSSHPDALFYRLYTRFTRLTSRLTGAHPMAWGYPSALGAPSELQALLGAIKPERLPASSQQLTALVRSCDACRFWLATWWSCKEQCKEITALHGNMPALSSQLERKSPEKQLSMAQAHVRQTIKTCEQYFSASSPNLSPPGASAVERYLGLSWQLLWSLDDLANHSTSVDWLHWPKPPLPWSEA
jgi:hypothetical protein